MESAGRPVIRLWIMIMRVRINFTILLVSPWFYPSRKAQPFIERILSRVIEILLHWWTIIWRQGRIYVDIFFVKHCRFLFFVLLLLDYLFYFPVSLGLYDLVRTIVERGVRVPKPGASPTVGDAKYPSPARRTRGIYPLRYFRWTPYLHACSVNRTDKSQKNMNQ